MGTLGIYSIFITKQQHLFWYVDTIKCYSIPSVPSGLEEVKTHPERDESKPRTGLLGPQVYDGLV